MRVWENAPVASSWSYLEIREVGMPVTESRQQVLVFLMCKIGDVHAMSAIARWVPWKVRDGERRPGTALFSCSYFNLGTCGSGRFGGGPGQGGYCGCEGPLWYCWTGIVDVVVLVVWEGKVDGSWG